VEQKDEKKFLRLFGKRLREIRIEKGLSQEDLANDSNIPINQIGRIERAQVNTTLKTIFKIARALDIDVKDFF
jgi:transcriptional regulator with XRE-family HTH domain